MSAQFYKFSAGVLAIVLTAGTLLASNNEPTAENTSSLKKDDPASPRDAHIVPSKNNCKQAVWPHNSACVTSPATAPPSRIITPATLKPSSETLRAAELQVSQQRAMIRNDNREQRKTTTQEFVTTQTSEGKNLKSRVEKKRVLISNYMLGYGHSVTPNNRHSGFGY